MTANTHEAYLLSLVDRVLSGDLGFDAFEVIYKDYYLERMPEDGLAGGSRRDFFAEALEQLDWTDVHPDAESRRYGWKDRAEYLEWLRSSRTQWSVRFESA